MTNMNYVTVLICTLITIFTACDRPSKSDATGMLQPDSLAWLVGSWKGAAGEAYFTESWTRVSDSLYSAAAYVIAGTDTVASEKISILFDGPDVYYIPVVSDQNDGLPVRFRLTSLSQQTLTFENPEHDFPQIITYSPKTGDSLIAIISGTDKGNHRSERFAMKRVTE